MKSKYAKRSTATKTPEVSIIVPVYNAAPYLASCLNTIAVQDVDFEAILVNDGSSDRSPEICNHRSNRDSRFKVISQMNAGASSARNAGLTHARGEWIIFVDADDELDSRMLRVMLDAAADTGADVVCCGVDVVQAGNVVVKSICAASKMESYNSDGALRMWLDEDGISTGPYTKLVRRDLLENNDIRFIEGEINEDVMYTALILEAAACVAVVGEPLYRYVKRAHSVTSGIDERYLAVLKNCQRLEAFCNGRGVTLERAVLRYNARAVWSCTLSSAWGGGARAQCPHVYRAFRSELFARLGDVFGELRGPKDFALLVLVLTGLYGLLRR